MRYLVAALRNRSDSSNAIDLNRLADAPSLSRVVDVLKNAGKNNKNQIALSQSFIDHQDPRAHHNEDRGRHGMHARRQPERHSEHSTNSGPAPSRYAKKLPVSERKPNAIGPYPV